MQPTGALSWMPLYFLQRAPEEQNAAFLRPFPSCSTSLCGRLVSRFSDGSSHFCSNRANGASFHAGWTARVTVFLDSCSQDSSASTLAPAEALSAATKGSPLFPTRRPHPPVEARRPKAQPPAARRGRVAPPLP